MDQQNTVAVVWVIAYCSLVVFVCGSLVELGVQPQVVVPVGLFVLPFLACMPSLVWTWCKKGHSRD